MKRILLLITIISLQNINSQNNFRKGYIINNKNDTINGYIDYKQGKDKYKTCFFKLSEDQDITKYNPHQLLGYRYLNHRVFLSREIVKDDNTSELVFLELLVRGTATLYRYLGVYYIEKDGEKFHKLSNEKIYIDQGGKKFHRNSNRHIAALSYLLSDCKEIKEKINKVKYDERPLTELIEEYNECTGQSVIFKEEKPWFEFHFGLAFGINSSHLNYKSDLQNTEHLTDGFNWANSIMPGINFNFSSPRTNERSSLTVGLFYIPATYKSYTIIKSSLITRYNEVTIEVEQLKIPISFKYTFPKNNFTPYINIGGSYTYHISSSSLWVQEMEVNNIVFTYESEPIEIGDGQLGLWGGFGVQRAIGNKISGFLEIRIEQTSGVAIDNPSLYGKDTLTNFQFLIGFNY